MNYAQYDLHIHTQWSYDAMTTLDEVFTLGRERHVRALAVTDHHLMDAYSELPQVAKRYPDVGYIIGAEFTIHCPLGTFDMVCLGLPLNPSPVMEPVLSAYRKWQQDFGAAESANLCRLGVPFDDAARLALLRTYRPEKAIALQGNTHVKYELLFEEVKRLGATEVDAQGIPRVFERFQDMPQYPEYDLVLPAVKKAGGIVMMAHPYGYFNHLERKRMDAMREMLDFDGIECAHPSFSPDISEALRNYCKEFHLLSSGGSDIHCAEGNFSNPNEITDFARHCGKTEWLDELLERVTLYHGGI